MAFVSYTRFIAADNLLFSQVSPLFFFFFFGHSIQTATTNVFANLEQKCQNIRSWRVEYTNRISLTSQSYDISHPIYLAGFCFIILAYYPWLSEIRKQLSFPSASVKCVSTPSSASLLVAMHCRFLLILDPAINYLPLAVGGTYKLGTIFP